MDKKSSDKTNPNQTAKASEQEMDKASNLNQQSPARTPSSNPKSPIKWIFLGALLTLLIAGTALGAYYLGTEKVSKNKEQAMEKANADQQSPTVTLSPEAEDIIDESLVSIGEDTVSFARTGSEILLRYRGKIYDESDQNAMQPVSGINSDNYTWYGLVNAPDSIAEGEFMFDEVFGLLSFPTQKSFAFIMRWGSGPGKTITYYLYYYNPNKTNKLNLINQFSQGDADYSVPKLDEFSKEGKYLALDMYGCWNCGGHQPEKLLLNLDTSEMKNIGRASYFEWKENGNYEYKDYVVIECDPPEQMGECSEDPASLPAKSGSF